MTTINFTLPLTAGGGANFPLLNYTSITMTNAPYTALQTDLASILQIVSGTLSSGQNLLYPVGVPGLAFLVANTTAQTITVAPVSGGGSTVPILAGTSSWVWTDGTNWNRGQELGSGTLTPPAGTGIAHVASGAFVTPAAPINLASNGVGGDVSGQLTYANGGTGLSTVGTTNQVIGTIDGATISWVSLTANMVGPAFTASLTQTGGNTITLITGATYTPAGLTATPAANSGGALTAATLADNQGHGPTSVLGDANPLSPPVATYTENTAGTHVIITLSETSGGVTSSPTVGAIWYDRNYQGLSSGGTATGVSIQASPATTATLAGGTAGGLVMTGTGGLATPVGQTYTINPTNQYWWFMCPHTSTAHTFQDANNAFFPFGMTRTLASLTVTNENGLSQTSYWDIYVSNFALTGLYKPYVAS
jgi:hypothetical protein